MYVDRCFLTMKKGILTFILLLFSSSLLYSNEENREVGVSQEEFQIMSEWDELENQINNDAHYVPEKWDGVIADYRGRLSTFSGEFAQSLEKILNRVEEVHKEKKRELEKAQNKIEKNIALHFDSGGLSSFRFIKGKKNWLDSKLELQTNDENRSRISWKAYVPYGDQESIWDEYGFRVQWQDFAANQYGSLNVGFNHIFEEKLGPLDLEAHCGFEVGGRYGDHNYDSAFLLRANLEAKVKLFRHIALELATNPDVYQRDEPLHIGLGVEYPLSNNGLSFSAQVIQDHNRLTDLEDLNKVEFGLSMSY